MFSQPSYGGLFNNQRKPVAISFPNPNNLIQITPMSPQFNPDPNQIQSNQIKKITVEDATKLIEDKVLKLEEELINLKKSNDDFQVQVKEKIEKKKPAPKKEKKKKDNIFPSY